MKNSKRFKEIGSNIREARKEAGMSQQELAKEVGFDSTTAISLLEVGERRVTIDSLEKIADVLGKSLDFFLEEGDAEQGQENKPDLKFALRADPDLSKEDKDAILRFIEMSKKKKQNGER